VTDTAAPLRRDIKRLGTILGNVLVEQGDLAVLELVERIRRDAERSDFASLVRLYSDDPSTKKSGGVLPYTKIPETPDLLRQPIASTDTGRVSAPIPVPGGLAIVKVLEREESSLPTYEEAKNELAQRVYLEKMNTARRTWLDSLRRQQHVEVRL